MANVNANVKDIVAADVEAILVHYDLGTVQSITPLTAGTVQTNLLLQTTQGKFVLRYYKQNRSFNAVRFEVNLIHYLKRHGYPCPDVLRDRQGRSLGNYRERPYALFEFMEGNHVEQPTAMQQEQLVQQVARLQLITHHYRPAYLHARWNYGIPFCAKLATEIAEKIGTSNAAAKLSWVHQTLAALELPNAHPKGICHCDFHFSNVLFKEGNFHALLDFDDANYTYLTFDLVALIEQHLFRFQWDNWQAVPIDGDAFDFREACKVVAIYEAVRPLSSLEKHHLFDVLKLATLIDCLWFFARGEVDSFYERRKIECLDALGRSAFTRALWG